MDELYGNQKLMDMFTSNFFQSRKIDFLLKKDTQCCKEHLFRENMNAYIEKILFNKNGRRREKQLSQIKDLQKENFRTKMIHIEGSIKQDM